MNNALKKFSPDGTYRQFRLSENVTIKTLKETLGESEGGSGDGKSKYEWNVMEIDSKLTLSVWDFKGCRWSCHGSLDLAQRLFGIENVIP